MAQINVTIKGASRDAKLTWNHKMKSLVGGPPNFSGSFKASPGKYVYAIVVFGNPTDPWTAAVTDGTITQNFAGHMSPSGFDTTGDTEFEVGA